MSGIYSIVDKIADSVVYTLPGVILCNIWSIVEGHQIVIVLFFYLPSATRTVGQILQNCKDVIVDKLASLYRFLFLRAV